MTALDAPFAERPDDRPAAAAQEPQNSVAAKPFLAAPDVVPGLARVLEIATLGASGAAAMLPSHFQRDDYAAQHVFCVVFVVAVYGFLAHWAELYRVGALVRPIAHADSVAVALFTSFVLLLSVIFGLDVGFYFEIDSFIHFFTGSLVALMLLRFAMSSALKLLSRRGVVGRNLAVLGVDKQSGMFLRGLARDPPYFTAVVGVFSPNPEPRCAALEGFPVFGTLDDLLACARSGAVDDVVVAMPWSDDKRVIGTIETLKDLPINVYLASDLVGFDLAFRPVLGAFSQLPVFEVVQRPIKGWGLAVKTIFDRAFAAAALAVLSPLLLLIALAVRLDSPGPVFFVQRRLGFNNMPFSIYKFRSMRVGADDGNAVRQATRRDSRVTRVGRIIRATSLDELPQLLNVLNGTMSLVGPRPHAMSHNEEYGRQIRGYFARHKVKPGITGWAQVNGLRGETADVALMRRRVEHDVYYVENWSFLFDLKILALTAVVVLFQKAAY